jgi:FixJ family two-component response regulator
MACATVFVVSDDPAVRDSISELVRSAGLRAEASTSLDAWRAAVQPERAGCLVLDARARDFACPEHLARFDAVCAERPVLMLVDRGDVPITVRAIKGGAVDVVEKPCRGETLLERIRRVVMAGSDSANLT